MLIKDNNGRYTLKVDKKRRIVYEKNVGSWEKEDYIRYWDEYKNNVMPYLGNGAWSKNIDMKEGIANTKVTPELLNEYAKWLVDNKCTVMAVVLNSTTLKMQMKRGSKDMPFEMDYFDNDEEADKWLKDKGF